MIKILLLVSQLAFAAGSTDMTSVIEENLNQEAQLRSKLEKNWVSHKNLHKARPNFKSTAEEVLGRPEPETINVRESAREARARKSREGAMRAEKNNLNRVSNEFGK